MLFAINNSNALTAVDSSVALLDTDTLGKGARRLTEGPYEVSRRNRSIHLACSEIVLIFGMLAIVVPSTWSLVRENPPPSPERYAEAEHRLAALIRELDQPSTLPMDLLRVQVQGAVLLQTFVALVALLSSLTFPGGLLLRLFGNAVVAESGLEVSRLRSLLRALVAWSPMLLVLSGETLLLPQLSSVSSWVALCGILLAGALFAIRQPERGIQDRIAGTYLVPR